MKRNNPKPYNQNPKLNVYSGAPVNQGFYKRNLGKAKKLYMDEYDRLKQQILKRRQDREFQNILSNYYDEYNKLAKKHPYLCKNVNYNEPQEQKTFNYNQYEIKKKSINAIFFKSDNNENDFDFKKTDDLIESMYDGRNISYLNSLEIKKDYNKRLSTGKTKGIINHIDTNNSNLYSTEKNIDLSIISDKNKNKQENLVNYFKAENKEEKDAPIKLTGENNINNNKNENKEEKKETKEIININEEKEDELTRYKKYIKENKFPCFEYLLNPFNPIDYIPPSFIPEISEQEKNESMNKEKSENNEYNDFIDNEDNKKEDNQNLLELSNNFKNDNNKFPKSESIIKEDVKGENSNSQNNIILQEDQLKNKKEKESVKKEESNEDDYENEKFDNFDNENIEDNENKELNNNNNNNEIIANNDKDKINEYNDGQLKMINDIIQDNKYPTFNQIINPYYQTNYLPPEVFIESKTQVQENILESENKKTESRNTTEVALNNNFDEENKNSSNRPTLEENIVNNQNQILGNIINSNYNYNELNNNNFGYPMSNKTENENEKKEQQYNNDKQIYNQNLFGIKNINDYVSIQNLIDINQPFPNNNEIKEENKYNKEENKSNKEEEYEYYDFENK